MNLENLRKELINKYVEDRAIPVSINIASIDDEILIKFDTKQYSFFERFKDDISIENIFEVMDDCIYREDYKYAYYELNKIFIKNSIDISELEEIFGDDLKKIIDEGIMQLQENRRKAKNEVDKNREKLFNTIADIRKKIKERI